MDSKKLANIASFRQEVFQPVSRNTDSELTAANRRALLKVYLWLCVKKLGRRSVHREAGNYGAIAVYGIEQRIGGGGVNEGCGPRCDWGSWRGPHRQS